MKILSFSLFAITLIAAPVHAESMQSGTMHDGSTMGGHTMPAGSMPAASMPSMAPMSEGVVRKVDTAAGKITLKHGPLANLDMPPMTMVFRVQPPELLNKVKAGDTVKFRAENLNGALTVTAIEKVQ